jgi:hypothetical protein
MRDIELWKDREGHTRLYETFYELSELIEFGARFDGTFDPPRASSINHQSQILCNLIHANTLWALCTFWCHIHFLTFYFLGPNFFWAEIISSLHLANCSKVAGNSERRR